MDKDIKCVELSDGSVYAIANKVVYNNKKYVQLLKIDDDSDFVFAENVGKELIFVEDEDLKLALIQEIATSMLEALKKQNQ